MQASLRTGIRSENSLIIVDVITHLLEIDGSTVNCCHILGLSSTQGTFSKIPRLDHMIIMTMFMIKFSNCYILRLLCNRVCTVKYSTNLYIRTLQTVTDLGEKISNTVILKSHEMKRETFFIIWRKENLNKSQNLKRLECSKYPGKTERDDLKNDHLPST